MTKQNIEIKMLVEGYREISEKRLADTNEYYVQLQTSFINDNGDLEQVQVKVMKKIDFKSLLGKVVNFINPQETVIEFNKFYKADDIEIIKSDLQGIEIKKSMIMDVIAVSDKTTKDNITNGFLFSKDIVDGAVLTYKVKIKNSNRKKLAEVKNKTIKLNNLSVFTPQDSFVSYYSVESIKDISIVK